MSDASSKPQPAIRPSISWHPVIGVALVLALYFTAPLLGSIILGPFIVAGRLSDSGVLTQFLFIAIIEVFTVAGLVLFLRRRGKSLAILGFGKPKLRHAGIGLAVYPLYFIFFVLLFMAATTLFPGLDPEQAQKLGFDEVIGALPLIMTFISLVILPPIVEELTVRGMLFTSLRSKMTVFWSTMLTSVIFAVAHLQLGSGEPPLYIVALDTFALSVVLCYVREKTGSLWPCITLHALKNGIAFLSLYILM